MDVEKIQRFEEKIKKLHETTIYNGPCLSVADKTTYWKEFWHYHIAAVIDIAKQLAKDYQADMLVVWLAAMLHDISKLSEKEPHEKYGSDMAYEMLVQEGFDKETALKVKSAILTHRCKNNPPTTLEEKIVASADAVSHFTAPFYLWFMRYLELEVSLLMEKSAYKLERDFNEKIFFEKERESVRAEYETLKKWFNYSKEK